MANYTEIIDRVMSGDYDEASPEERDEAVQKITQMGAIAAAAVAVQPVPFVDVILISPIQVAMVQAIGRIHGHRLDQKSVLEILASFGASLVAQNVIIAAAKFVPFFGWIVGVSMAYALTWAVGEVSDHYFRNRGVPASELREMFDRVYKEKRAEKEAANKDNRTLKQKLQQLNEARQAGLLDDDEFEAKKQQLLADF